MAATAPDPVTLTRVLHASVVLRRGPVGILIDPCFGTFTRRRLTSKLFGIRMPDPGCDPASLAGLSAIALTHGHEDHFDAEGMARLPDRAPRVIVGDRGLAARVRRLGFRDVEWLRPWSSAAGPGWRITATPARAPNALREVPYVADLGGYGVFHGGDTAAHRSFGEIGRRLAPRAACLPVNGVSLLGLRLTMTPLQAASAAAELGVEVTVPVHDEMVFERISRLLYRTHGGGGAFAEAMARGHPGIRVLRPPRGGTVRLDAAP